MTNVVTANTTETTLKTVHIDWTTSQIIRIVANVDFPQYAVRKGQTIYLVRSSANDGNYYLLAWGDRKATGWSCSCMGYEVYGKCRHVKLANMHSRERAKRIVTQKAAQEQARKERMVAYRLASFFEALYVHALQQIAQGQPEMQVVAANKELTAPLVKVTIVENQPARYCSNCQCTLPLQVVNGKKLCAVCASHTITKDAAPLQGRNYKLINGIPMR